MPVKENQSVRNACDLIEAIARAQPIGVSDLARSTGVNKSAAQRLAVSLQSAGWLHQDADGRWRIAPVLSALVAPASQRSLVDIVRPTLDRIRDECGETAMLVAIERDELIVQAVADSRHALRITAPAGSQLPLAHSSALRAIAIHVGDDELARLRRLDPSLDDATLAKTRQRGWALNDREITPDARVVGTAVIGGDGRPLGAIIVCAPASRASVAVMHQIGALIAAAAEPQSLGIAAVA